MTQFVPGCVDAGWAVQWEVDAPLGWSDAGTSWNIMSAQRLNRCVYSNIKQRPTGRRRRQQRKWDWFVCGILSIFIHQNLMDKNMHLLQQHLRKLSKCLKKKKLIITTDSFFQSKVFYLSPYKNLWLSFNRFTLLNRMFCNKGFSDEYELQHLDCWVLASSMMLILLFPRERIGSFCGATFSSVIPGNKNRSSSIFSEFGGSYASLKEQTILKILCSVPHCDVVFQNRTNLKNLTNIQRCRQTTQQSEQEPLPSAATRGQHWNTSPSQKTQRAQLAWNRKVFLILDI